MYLSARKQTCLDGLILMTFFGGILQTACGETRVKPKVKTQHPQLDSASYTIDLPQTYACFISN